MADLLQKFGTLTFPSRLLGGLKVFEIRRDALGLNISLVRSVNASACVLVAYDSVTRKITAYPAGLYSSAVEEYGGIPPNRRCD